MEVLSRWMSTCCRPESGALFVQFNPPFGYFIQLGLGVRERFQHWLGLFKRTLKEIRRGGLLL